MMIHCSRCTENKTQTPVELTATTKIVLIYTFQSFNVNRQKKNSRIGSNFGNHILLSSDEYITLNEVTAPNTTLINIKPLCTHQFIIVYTHTYIQSNLY